MPKYHDRRTWKDLKKYCPRCKKEYGWGVEKCKKCGIKLSIKLPLRTSPQNNIINRLFCNWVLSNNSLNITDLFAFFFYLCKHFLYGFCRYHIYALALA